MRVGGGGCVRGSSRTAQVQLSKNTSANKNMNSENRRQSFPDEQRKNAVSWTIIIMIASCPGALAESFGQVLLLLEVMSSFFSSLCLPPTALFMAAPFLHPCSQTSPLSSLHPPSAANVSRDAQSQDKWPISLQGCGLKPTTLAQYLHVEQEQAAESIHNYFKVDRDFCSQPPDNLCLEEGGRPDVSNYGLKVLCIGLLEICCHPVQTHDAWPGITTAGLRDAVRPQWCNVTCSAERKPGWLCKETSELSVTLNTMVILSFLFPSEPSSVLRFIEHHFFQVYGKVFWAKDLDVLSYSMC